MRPGNETKTRLVESAMLCFAKHGYEGASIRKITAKINLNPSLLAYHFGSKAGLYRETLCHIFQHRGSLLLERIATLPVGPGVARHELVQGLQDYLMVMVEALMAGDFANPVEMAAMTLMSREIQNPTPGFEELLMDFLRPSVAYMEGCLKGLCPDLDKEARDNMSLSIHAQVFILRNAIGVIRLTRGDPSFPANLPALIQHFVDFSMRGLGLPEAFPPHLTGHT